MTSHWSSERWNSGAGQPDKKGPEAALSIPCACFLNRILLRYPEPLGPWRLRQEHPQEGWDWGWRACLTAGGGCGRFLRARNRGRRSSCYRDSELGSYHLWGAYRLRLEPRHLRAEHHHFVLSGRKLLHGLDIHLGKLFPTGSQVGRLLAQVLLVCDPVGEGAQPATARRPITSPATQATGDPDWGVMLLWLSGEPVCATHGMLLSCVR